MSKKVRDKRSREYGCIPLKVFLSDSAEKVCGQTLLCLRMFWLSNNFRHKRVVSRFSVDIFLSGGTERLRRGNFLCCVSENCR